VLNRAVGDGPGFTGHVEDSATGLTYMQQRYYDSLGLFPAVDPVTAYDSGDWRHFNRYAYAYNNPFKFTDPDGRAAHIAIGGGVGALFGGGMELYRQLRTDGRVSSWTNVGIETAKGGVVGALTAAVPGSAALTFGGTTAKAAVSIGNAAAVGAAGEVAGQVAKGEAIDTGKALTAGVANGVGVAGGMVAAPLAKAMATTPVPGNPGFQVTSLRGQTFTVDAIPTSTTTSEGLKQTIQDTAGTATGAYLDDTLRSP